MRHCSSVSEPGNMVVHKTTSTAVAAAIDMGCYPRKSWVILETVFEHIFGRSVKLELMSDWAWTVDARDALPVGAQRFQILV